MTTEIETKLTASLLVQKSKCPCYTATKFKPTPEMLRGTHIDTAYRHMLAGKREKYASLEEDSAREAVDWSVGQVQSMAAGTKILSEKRDLRLAGVVSGITVTGELDTALPDSQSFIELKSGGKYDYSGQLYTYAALFMHKHNLGTCKSHTLYCDLRVVETSQYTYETAMAYVTSIVDTVIDVNRKPTPERRPRCNQCVHSNEHGQCTLM